MTAVAAIWVVAAAVPIALNGVVHEHTEGVGKPTWIVVAALAIASRLAADFAIAGFDFFGLGVTDVTTGCGLPLGFFPRALVPVPRSVWSLIRCLLQEKWSPLSGEARPQHCGTTPSLCSHTTP